MRRNVFNLLGLLAFGIICYAAGNFFPYREVKAASDLPPGIEFSTSRSPQLTVNDKGEALASYRIEVDLNGEIEPTDEIYMVTHFAGVTERMDFDRQSIQLDCMTCYWSWPRAASEQGIVLFVEWKRDGKILAQSEEVTVTIPEQDD